jgi:hypothetical protein
LSGTVPLRQPVGPDFDLRVVVPASIVALWAASPEPGVQRHRLDGLGHELARAISTVRHDPGLRYSRHTHGGATDPQAALVGPVQAAPISGVESAAEPLVAHASRLRAAAACVAAAMGCGSARVPSATDYQCTPPNT